MVVQLSSELTVLGGASSVAVTGRVYARTSTIPRLARPMKLVMTLLVRDEADVVDAHVAFHLNAGVDYVDRDRPRSSDGTTEILERYARDGLPAAAPRAGRRHRQAEWVTRMARLAATELGADWVIHTDADEFWWPRGGSLKEVLATVPARYGIVRGLLAPLRAPPRRRVVLRGAHDRAPRTPAHPGDKPTICHAHQKVAHRADPGGRDRGREPQRRWHRASRPLRGWHPVEVLHFPFRSVEQLERKARGGWMAKRGYEPTAAHGGCSTTAVRGRAPDRVLRRVAVDDDASTEVSRTARSPSTPACATRCGRSATATEGFARPRSARRASRFRRPSAADDAAIRREASVLVEIDGVVRAERAWGARGAAERSSGGRSGSS